MSTGRDFIYAALQEISAYGAEDTPDAAGVNYALSALNRMWGGWMANLGAVNAETLESFALIPGQEVYSFGTGGNFNSARPLKIMSAQLRYAGNVDTPIEIVSFERYQEIATKTVTADLALKMAYNATFPLGTIYFWPVPTIAYSLRITTLKALAVFDLDTTLDLILPPGYEDAIVPNLALRLAPQWGKSPSALLVDLARETKANIDRMNTVIEEMEGDPSTPGSGRSSGRRFNWRIG